MKRIIIASLIFPIVTSLTEPAQAQGTLYLSSLSDRSSSYGPFSIGSDSWWAEGFITGINSDGYALNSIQLRMAATKGNPSNLSVSLYGSNVANGRPGNILVTLAGSLNPMSPGIYAYTASNVILLPNTLYYAVLSAETPTATGAYLWDSASKIPDDPNNWAFYYLNYNSANNGLTWGANRLDDGQMAIYATAVPEPAAGVLFGLGALFLRIKRRQHKSNRCRHLRHSGQFLVLTSLGAFDKCWGTAANRYFTLPSQEPERSAPVLGRSSDQIGGGCGWCRSRLDFVRFCARDGRTPVQGFNVRTFRSGNSLPNRNHQGVIKGSVLQGVSSWFWLLTLLTSTLLSSLQWREKHTPILV